MLFINSCSDTNEQKVERLAGSWLLKDTVLVSQERLETRYQKALEYVEMHYLSDNYDRNTCFNRVDDSLRIKSVNFRIITEPLVPSDFNMFDELIKDQNLMMKWSCEVYNIDYDSLVYPTSNSDGKLDLYNYLLNSSSEVFDKVDRWQNNNSEVLHDQSMKALSTLQSDTSKTEFLLFEYPTGKTLTAYTVYYPYYNNEKEVQKNPHYMLEQIGGTIIFFIFTDDDEIKDVWFTWWDY